MKLVSINNIPEELRTQFKDLSKESQQSIEIGNLLQSIPDILFKSANSEGLVYFEVLKNLL